VNRQLKLINNLYSYKKFFPYINFFTQKEETILKDVYKNFACKIFKTSDNIYQYKDFKFPHSIFGSNVLYYEHGISTLKNSNFKNRDIIDAGACCGDSALVLSKYTNKKVYSFEPCTQQFNLLEKTIKLNSKTNIVPVKFGLGSKKESTKIGIYDDVGSNSTVSPMTPNSYEYINITTIDDYVNENNLEIGLIKADIEGMELFMLKGAINTIKKFRPTLIISIYHNINDYFYIKEYIENLNLNYKFRIYHPEIGTIFSETCLIAEVED